LLTWQEVDRTGETTYYDSVSGKPLFVAPRGRTFAAFEAESRSHGWPSFRDEEVVWDNVRCLPDGEAVSLAGTHLGHNLPDRKGNRYCACARAPVHGAAVWRGGAACVC
jgi:peptide methionine sulfoxide reductase MsrB